MNQRQKNPRLAGGEGASLEGAWDLLLIDVSANDQEYASLGRGFHINTDGNLAFKTEQGSDVVIAVKAGMYYPYFSQKVIKIGTTCTGHIIF